MSRKSIDLVCFDADDTLWQCEKFFQLTQQSFAGLLQGHVDTEDLAERLLAAEKRNLSLYGFGVKGFMLSMIETAIEISDDGLPIDVIRQIMASGRDMLAHPIELLPHAEEAIRAVADECKVVLITKGDLFDQERKVAQSGIGELFDGVEVVADKSTDVYRRLFTRYGSNPSTAVMVGNSMKSDVLPVLEAGGWGIYVPHELTWSIEHGEEPREHTRFRRIASLAELPRLLGNLHA